MMERGLILLDVDGVISPESRNLDDYLTYMTHPKLYGTIRVRVDPKIGKFLTELAEATGWELVWATKWEHDANRWIAPILGVPQLPVIEFESHPGTVSGWKFPAVLEYAQGRPMVWLDDSFLQYADLLPDFHDGRGSLPTLLYSIEEMDGVRVDDLSRVMRWIRGVSLLAS